MMKVALLALTSFAMLIAIDDAVAQYGPRVPPRWNAAGSAVCPDGYDYYAGWCRARGYGYGRGYYGPSRREGVPPRWNALGSAVCPDGYDYYIQYNRCLPR
jgi:hypothetical protein